MKEAEKQPSRTGTPGLTGKLGDLGGVSSLEEEKLMSVISLKQLLPGYGFPGLSK